jgi:hypothetical protein
MNLYCLLIVPACAFLVRLDRRRARLGFAAALAGGALTALLGLLTGGAIAVRSYGLSAWMDAAIDGVLLPVGFPALVWILIGRSRWGELNLDADEFLLWWLAPMAAARAALGGPSPDFGYLVLQPTLWIALAIGWPFLARLIAEEIGWRFALGVFGVAALPAAAVFGSWLAFGHHPWYALPLVVAAAAPAVASLALDQKKADSAARAAESAS